MRFSDLLPLIKSALQLDVCHRHLLTSLVRHHIHITWFHLIHIGNLLSEVHQCAVLPDTDVLLGLMSLVNPDGFDAQSILLCTRVVLVNLMISAFKLLDH